ncbi:alanyl-tRNA editing protein [Marinobacter sp. M1N3S26]|uniref:alanyl-tRNA editing protein n=1 Tax=unclassified Marinobacter TaxID=83889 RepID=UPI00387B9419
MRTTQKLYYKDQYLTECQANISRLYTEAVELDRTVAFPEGGGQEADHGIIHTPVGMLRFEQVKRMYGTPCHIEGFKGVKTGGVILHLINTDDLPLLAKLQVGMPVTVRINALRRARLTLSHSASHFLYAAAMNHDYELEERTIGCHIKEDSARFDFLSDEKFDGDSIQKIESVANSLIEQNLPIKLGSLPDCPDARYWRYGGLEIPCGGTHLERPGAIGSLRVRRKNVGKGKERLICEFPEACPDVWRYHQGMITA